MVSVGGMLPHLSNDMWRGVPPSSTNGGTPDIGCYSLFAGQKMVQVPVHTQVHEALQVAQLLVQASRVTMVRLAGSAGSAPAAGVVTRASRLKASSATVTPITEFLDGL
jgi:hypothetical protein